MKRMMVMVTIKAISSSSSQWHHRHQPPHPNLPDWAGVVSGFNKNSQSWEAPQGDYIDGEHLAHCIVLPLCQITRKCKKRWAHRQSLHPDCLQHSHQWDGLRQGLLLGTCLAQEGSTLWIANTGQVPARLVPSTATHWTSLFKWQYIFQLILVAISYYRY